MSEGMKLSMRKSVGWRLGGGGLLLFVWFLFISHHPNLF